MKILYMGTPEISARVLSSLIADGQNIAAVVTREDKPRGRGNVLTPTETRIVANENGIVSYTPKSLRDPEFFSLLKEINPDIIVVVAYGKILPPEVLSYPKYGCINLHVSLLPKYRGSAPMQRAIMNGENETGVTIMYMDEGLDTGDIIARASFPIGKRDNLETVYEKSIELGAPLLINALSDIENGKAKREKQVESRASYAPKIEKSELKIDFDLDAKKVSATVRGLTPPGAYALHNGKNLRLYDVEAVAGEGEIGRVIAVNPKGDGSFDVACKTGAIRVYSVVPEGKGKMSAGDYLRGRKIDKGDLLT